MFVSTRARRFRELYLFQLDFVWTVLRRLGVPHGSVEDAAHDVFLVVHRRLDEFEGRSSERTWLYAIARRVAWRHRRALRRRTRKEGALARDAIGRVGPDAEEFVRRSEAQVLLAAFLETLDTPKREAFVLGEIERLPRASLARALGVKPSTAYSRLCAARADFQHAFGPEGPRLRGVQRAARSTERPPAAARQRVWIALPAVSFGSVVASAGLAAVAGAGLLGLFVVVRPLVDPPRVHAQTPRSVTARVASASPPTVTVSSRTAGGPISGSDAVVSAVAPPRGDTPRLRPVTDGDRRTSRPSSALSSVSPTASHGVAQESSADRLAHEAALLSRARAQMQAKHWRAARAALRAHATQYPTGHLVTERLSSQVTVACAMGAKNDALAYAAALLRGRAGEHHRAPLRATCIGSRLSGDSVVNSRGPGDQQR